MESSFVLERADGAQDVAGVRSNLDVPRHREPPHDPVAIDDDGRRAWNVLPLGTCVSVHQAVASRDGEIAVGDEAVAEAQIVGDLLAPLVGIG
jgi:hypothetical protein